MPQASAPQFSVFFASIINSPNMIAPYFSFESNLLSEKVKCDLAGFQVSEAVVKLDVISGNSKSMGVGTLYR